MCIIRQIIPECGKQNKSKTVTKVFFLSVYRWVELRNLQEPLIWAVVSCAIPSAMNRQMRAEIVWVTTVKKLLNQSGWFEKKNEIQLATNGVFENRTSP